jgi:hypothetical protein
MDPYVDACRRFRNSRLRYVIVGAFGINLYAQQVGQVITTADCDILIPAHFAAFRKALQTLLSMGFVLEAGAEPVPDLDPALIQGILRARAVVSAERPDARIDVCTQVAGAAFEELWRTHREFIVEGVKLRVAALKDLVKSKRVADRPKDRLFLQQHKETIEALLRKREPP